MADAKVDYFIMDPGPAELLVSLENTNSTIAATIIVELDLNCPF